MNRRILMFLAAFFFTFEGKIFYLWRRVVGKILPLAELEGKILPLAELEGNFFYPAEGWWINILAGRRPAR